MKYYTIEEVFGDTPWKIIEDFPRYAISADGRVYSFISKRTLSPETVYNGYLRVSLSDGNGIKHRRVHVLVAEAFLEKPEGATQVHHLNHDKQDNRVENLAWVSQQENLRQRRPWRKKK